MSIAVGASMRVHRRWVPRCVSIAVGASMRLIAARRLDARHRRSAPRCASITVAPSMRVHRRSPRAHRRKPTLEARPSPRDAARPSPQAPHSDQPTQTRSLSIRMPVERPLQCQAPIGNSCPEHLPFCISKRHRKISANSSCRRYTSCYKALMKAQPASQLSLLPARKPHGGKRRNAGRKPAGNRAGSPHLERPTLAARHPVHVVLRAVDAVGNLRRRHAYHAIRTATLVVGNRDDFRIVQLSIQHNHVHLIVEAADKHALAKGMQAFQISAAKQINRAISKRRPGPRRRGSVFPDRYHAEIITSPRQARHALSYVMNNWRKHGEDRHGRMQAWKIDWFSSAIAFVDWAEYGDSPWLWRGPQAYEPLWVRQPTMWLLRTGWKRHGLISYREVPGARA
ncbi:MAG TPA: transposase [Kofleriaceae bacterium]|nr:transposase [Kofleriaceae bacterium]